MVNNSGASSNDPLPNDAFSTEKEVSKEPKMDVDAATTLLLKDRRIFVVEDNLDNRVITRISLLRHGAWLEFDRWGHETLTRLRNFMPLDLIIMDLMLPNGASGYTIVEKLQQDATFAQIPVVAVSAAEPNSSIAKCKEMGFAGFIAKPIDDDLFPEQIARIINGEHLWYTGSSYR